MSDDQEGLSTQEAQSRLAADGPNEIAREKPISPLAIFAEQFKSPLIWLLLVAAVASGLLGEVIDAIAIGAILVLNAFVGFFQEYRAERAVLALRAMTGPRARVQRDGHATMIPANELVRGDLLLLEAGDIVAADAKLLEASRLQINEAALTGESLPVEKSAAPVGADAPLAERHDAVFMGTSVAAGTARASVTGVGMKTELGKVAHLLASAQESATPLQQRLAKVSRTLLYLCLVLVAIVAVLGVVRGQPALEVFLSAVSLAVAAIPEGLPAVVTIALAIGVQRMVSHNVLVRRLNSVETLGCATVICSDKTGTLTTGVMKVRELSGVGDQEILDAAAACCDAELGADERTGVGDPTEVAILLRALEAGIRRADIEAQRPRRSSHPFDTERKRMSVSRENGVIYVKGAVETVLPLCKSGDLGGAEATNQTLAARGLRVLAIAVGEGDKEENLRLLGLIGIADPPRPEAIAAVAAARSAGIRTVMITGDHRATAEAIGRELGIILPGEDPAERVHARATPEDKLTIVRSWKDRGEIVAMTGDGVNDAPALREAHIGIAMGITGTEVTREASDMLLTDDNFASIVAAVREGRGIFDNIRKTLVYLLAGNAGELAVMLGAALMGLPLPLLPLQLLWINLVTDGLPALALAMDPVDPDVMKRPPRRPSEPMLGRTQWIFVGVIGLLEATLTLSVFYWALEARTLQEARDLAFSVLVFAELFRAFAARSPDRVFFEVGAFTNLRLVGVVAISVGLQVALHSLPATRALFRIDPLSWPDFPIAFLLALLPVTCLELAKLLRRALTKKAATA